MAQEDGGGLEESRTWFDRQGLVRPREGRMLTGVCAGLARRYSIPVLVVRVVMVVVALSGPGLLIYIGLALLMPPER